MRIILSLKCSTADCQSPGIDGEEECHFRNIPRSVMTCDHGHQILYYGQGLLDDLHIKARAAGWHSDGTQWFCGPCANPGSITELADIHAEFVARSCNV